MAKTTGKVSFSNRAKGKTAIASTAKAAKFSTMNKNRRRSFKAYRGQGK
jgi:hypothetical protein